MNGKPASSSRNWSPLFREVVAKYGGVSQMARRLGCHRNVIYRWEGIPAARVDTIAADTGIPRTTLRPDMPTPAP